jgi:hypothetical protein
MISNPGRALGYGLLAAALGIALLMLVWLLTSGAQAGGAVLGLLLLFVLSGPLAGAGWYVIGRGRAEQATEQAFADKRRIWESDRLFRREFAARIAELQRKLPAQHASSLELISNAVKGGLPDESAWYGAIQLDPAQTAELKRYEDLTWEQVRWLREHADASEATVTHALADVRRALDRRADVLIRARPTTPISPAALLRSTGPATEGLAHMAVGDAVTRDGTDYVVDRIVSSFADGQTWTLAHLAPSGLDDADAWLSISPGGLEMAWLRTITASEPGRPSMTVDGTVLSSRGSTASLVSIVSTAGSAPGVLVHIWRYRSDDRVAQVEQWPDGNLVAYAGKIIQPRELEVWPAAPRTEEVALT